MDLHTKTWLIAAVFLVVLGLILFAAVMTSYHWDFAKLSTAKLETNTHMVTEEFRNITVTTDTADILFMPSEDNSCKVICTEETRQNHTVTIRDNCLTIDVEAGKWYTHIGIHFQKPQITIYLPQGSYGALTVTSDTGDVNIPKDFRFESLVISESTGDVVNYACASDLVKIKTSTGKIHTENISAATLDLSVSTGDITVSGVNCLKSVTIRVSTGKTKITDTTCNSLISNGNTGDISLKNVLATEVFSIERSTGDVSFDACDAGGIYVETDTGNVTGSLLSEKVFITHTDTGRVNTPKGMTGGSCEITTNTGNISITLD